MERTARRLSLRKSLLCGRCLSSTCQLAPNCCWITALLFGRPITSRTNTARCAFLAIRRMLPIRSCSAAVAARTARCAPSVGIASAFRRCRCLPWRSWAARTCTSTARTTSPPEHAHRMRPLQQMQHRPGVCVLRWSRSTRRLEVDNRHLRNQSRCALWQAALAVLGLSLAMQRAVLLRLSRMR